MYTGWYDGALFRESCTWEWQPDPGRLRVFYHSVRPGHQQSSQQAALANTPPSPLRVRNSRLNTRNVAADPLVFWWKDKLTVETDYLVDADFTSKRKQYMSRGDIQGYVLPGIRASFAVSLHFWDQFLYKISESEFLLASHGALHWECASNGAVPASALPTGMSAKGVPIYTARVRRATTPSVGTLLPGELGSRVMTDIAEELIFPKYEVLCLGKPKNKMEDKKGSSVLEPDLIDLDLSRDFEDTPYFEEYNEECPRTITSAYREVMPMRDLPGPSELSLKRGDNAFKSKLKINCEGSWHDNGPQGFISSSDQFDPQSGVNNLSRSPISSAPNPCTPTQNSQTPAEASTSMNDCGNHADESGQRLPHKTKPMFLCVCSPNSKGLDVCGSVHGPYLNTSEHNENADHDEYISEPKKFKIDYTISKQNESDKNAQDDNESPENKPQQNAFAPNGSDQPCEQKETSVRDPVQNNSLENESEQNVSEFEMSNEYEARNSFLDEENGKEYVENSEKHGSEMNKYGKRESQQCEYEKNAREQDENQQHELQFPECKQKESEDNESDASCAVGDRRSVGSILDFLGASNSRDSDSETTVASDRATFNSRTIDDVDELFTHVPLPWITFNSQVNVHNPYGCPSTFDSNLGLKLNLAYFRTAKDMDVSANEAFPAAAALSRELTRGERVHIPNIGFGIWSPTVPNYLELNQQQNISNEFDLNSPYSSDDSDTESAVGKEDKEEQNQQADVNIGGKGATDKNSDSKSDYSSDDADHGDRVGEFEPVPAIDEENSIEADEEEISEDEQDIPVNYDRALSMPQWRDVDGYSLQDLVVAGETVFGGRTANGQDLWVSRFSFHGHLLPDGHDRGDMSSYSNPLLLEVLLVPRGCPFLPNWVKASDGDVPAGAFPAGATMDGEVAYVARARHAGLLIPGRLVPSEGGCMIRDSARMQMVLCKKYEVLTFC